MAGHRRGGSVQGELSRQALILRVLRDRRQAGRLELDGDPVHRQRPVRGAARAERGAGACRVAACSGVPAAYNVTGSFPVTQGMLNAGLEAALGRALHSLDELGWGAGGILFGPCSAIADRTPGDLTGWQPQVTLAAESAAGLLSSGVPHTPHA